MIKRLKDAWAELDEVFRNEFVFGVNIAKVMLIGSFLFALFGITLIMLKLVGC